jgi:2',3'-cyclic-nucleotide 2'-phosphodiesterase/3'-nucleotidase
MVTKEGDHIGVFAGAEIMINGGDKIVGVMINGVPLDNNKYYKMATIDFLITGGNGFDFSNMKYYKDTGIPVRDVIKDYWEKNDANIAPNWQNVKVSR